ncbi:MAG: hypothetical protein R2873_22615 [Caldilineaceae bacterium]
MPCTPSLWRRVAAFVIVLLSVAVFAGVSVVLAQETSPVADSAIYLPFVVDGVGACPRRHPPQH